MIYQLQIVNCVTGTFEPEQETDDLVYGTVHQLHSWNPVYVQVFFCVQSSRDRCHF